MAIAVCRVIDAVALPMLRLLNPVLRAGGLLLPRQNCGCLVNKILPFFLFQLWLLVLSPYCCCLANAVVVVTFAVGRMMLLPRQCCCCVLNTFTNTAFGTVYNAVFSL